MQYPQIQFYKGSLVRLASGKLKQVQDLSSDDFLESARLIRTSSNHHISQQQQQQQPQPLDSAGGGQSLSNDDLTRCEEVYADSVVVRDFLEVGPASVSPNAPSSPSSSVSSQTTQPDSLNLTTPTSATPNGGSTSSSSGGNQHLSAQQQHQQNPMVLIKFFLESSRSTVYIEVPIEHPFFVFHRGWSSWNPQRTCDKFGLKCRKLKIGDTCISMIRSKAQKQHQAAQPAAQPAAQLQQSAHNLNSLHAFTNHHHHHPHQQHQQRESEQFNMLFQASIKF